MFTGAEGQRYRVRIDESVRDLNRIRDNAELRLMIVEPMVIQIHSTDATSPPSADMVVLNVKGDGAAAARQVRTSTQTATAKVQKLDRAQKSVTLALPSNQTRQMKVADNVDFAQLREGQEVRIRYTDAVAVGVEGS